MSPSDYLEKKILNEHFSIVLEGHCKEYIDGFARGMKRALEIFVETADLYNAQHSAELAEKLKNSDLRIISGGTE